MNPAPKCRVALVTGASSGFGFATATRLAQRGFRVFGTSRSGACAAASFEILPLDVDKSASVQACVALLLERAGRLDIVVNNAGRALVGACEETSAEEARALFETNLFGTMRVVSAALPTMRQQRRGTIVNVGSLSGFVGVSFHGIYAASKHALAGYTEALRLEVQAFGVRVSLIEPAAHRTEIQMLRPHRLLSHYDAGRDRVEAIIRKQIEHGDSPERVVDAIVSAATSAHPRMRYRVGRKAAWAAWARRLLSASAFETMMSREFQLSTAPATEFE
jgi:NAD(P)-dependent dehydrogenase (short-subunit alcohol dehydrogenase family)